MKNSLKVGDWLVLALSLLLVSWLFTSLWSNQPAGKARIRVGDKVYATLSLNQDRKLEIIGALGISQIEIERGKVRFVASPCHNQYCVHQGWLSRAGQAAVCLPNRVSIELLGEKRFDSLNY
ncbi:MAG: NusG domain II-containing protein [Methylophilaceae bacterium]